MNHSFNYVHCDIPEGRTILEHRRARADRPKPVRRGLLKLFAGRRRSRA